MVNERLKIEGMGCNHCVSAVRDALQELGVEVHDVKIGHADISYGAAVDRNRIDAAIIEAGYTPVGREALA